MLCLKYIWCAGHLRGHRPSSPEHLNLARVQKMKHRKPVGGGPLTHGEPIDKLYERFPDLLFESSRRVKRKRLLKFKSLIANAALCNEFGSADRFKHSHSHGYFESMENMFFKDLRKNI